MATTLHSPIKAPDLHLFQAMAGAELGGAETFFERLALGFHDHGLRQTLAIKPWPGRLNTLAGIAPRPCAFRPVPGFIDRMKLKRMIDASGADIILSWMNRATRLTPKTGIPHIARLGGFYDLKYYRDCDLLVANTRGIADYLVQQGWPAGRVRVQVNFVPDGLDTPDPDGGNQPTGDDETVFVSLGRFHPNKGFDTLLNAFAGVPSGRLRLAGDGPEKARLMALAEQLGIASRVEFCGWQANPQSFIRSGDIFICPSRHEPFGNVIMEAFACRMPVITTASDGATENASHGDTALIIPVDDCAAMTDAMTNLQSDPALAGKLAGKAYQAYQKGFTETAVIRGWFDLLAEVAG